MPKITLSYYPWITQTISGAPLQAAVATFADLLRTQLRAQMGNNVDVDVPKVFEIPDQIDELKVSPSGDVIAKIGLLNPIGYALARKDLPAVEGVAVIMRPNTNGVGPFYNAQLYTHRKTFLKKKENMKVEDIRGHSLAFGS